VLPAPRRSFLDCFLCLFLAANKKNLSTASCYFLEKFGRPMKLPRSLIEVDDVDLITFFKDVRLHLRVPALGLMTKVDPCFEQFRY
jgi:hypothetical protein